MHRMHTIQNFSISVPVKVLNIIKFVIWGTSFVAFFISHDTYRNFSSKNYKSEFERVNNLFLGCFLPKYWSLDDGSKTIINKDAKVAKQQQSNGCSVCQNWNHNHTSIDTPGRRLKNRYVE
jgi:hypothetical protein